MPKVTVYSTSTCHYCKDAKEFLSTHGVKFDEFNVGTDAEKRAEMLSLTGERAVPTIVVNDQVFVGYDKFRDAVDKGLVLA